MLDITWKNVVCAKVNNYYREKSTLQFNQFSRPTGDRQTHRKPVSLETGMQVCPADIKVAL